MATTFYPDIASYQEGIGLKGAVAVCAKATEGTTYLNPYYGAFKSEAAVRGTYFSAYHFLHHGDADVQAGWCHRWVGKTPLMLDVELTTSTRPTVGDAIAFIDRYRALGGICNLLYFPRWYWEQLGLPSLKKFVDRQMALVSSAYPASGYSDNGIGWNAYGGMTPAIWQYTSSQLFNGYRIDFNAFRGTLDELKALMVGYVDPYPMLREGDTGDAVSRLQERLNMWGANPPLKVDGDFGKLTEAAVINFQTRVFGPGPGVDGTVGHKTWAELRKNPPGPGSEPFWTFGPPRAVKVLNVGPTSVKLAITSPSAYIGKYPASRPGIHHYQISVNNGHGVNVPTYPRNLAKSTAAATQVWQGGSLPRKTALQARVRACLADGSHSSPWAKVEFTTT